VQQLLKVFRRFVQTYEYDLRSDLPKEALYVVARQMNEAAAVLLLSGQFRPGAAGLLVELLQSAVFPSSAGTSGAESLLLNMLLADACSTSLTNLEQLLFANTTKTTSKPGGKYRSLLRVNMNVGAHSFLLLLITCSFIWNLCWPRPALYVESEGGHGEGGQAIREPIEGADGSASTSDPRKYDPDSATTCETDSSKEDQGQGNDVIEALMVLVEQDMERALCIFMPGEEGEKHEQVVRGQRWWWSPIGPDLLSLQCLKIYQSQALYLLSNQSSHGLAYFALYGRGKRSKEDDDKDEGKRGEETQAINNDGKEAAMERELHYYLRHVIALSQRSLFALLHSLPSTATISEDPTAAQCASNALSAMRVTAVGELLLPFLQLALSKQLACPRFLRQLSDLLRPLHSVHDFFLR